MFSVVEVYCHRFIEEEWILEQIREFCSKHSAMMSGFMPERMEEVIQRNALYLIELKNYHPELIHSQVV